MKRSIRNQIMPNITKKAHTTQRGVGGMRRRPGKLIILLRIKTLQTFWAEHIIILIIFIFWIFLDPQLPDFQVPDFQISRFPGSQISKFADSQISRLPDAAGAGTGRTLRSQPDPSPNAPRDQIRRKDPCCDNIPFPSLTTNSNCAVNEFGCLDSLACHVVLPPMSLGCDQSYCCVLSKIMLYG